MALMDIIKQRRQTVAKPQTTAAEDIRQTVTQSRTGKDVTPSGGPATGNLLAQTAQAAGQAERGKLETQQQVGQQALGAAERQQTADITLQRAQQRQQLGTAQQEISSDALIAGQQRQAQEDMARRELQSRESRATQELTHTYSNALAELASQRKTTEQDIFSDAAMARAELQADQYAAYLDQVAHIAAMSDQEYIDELRRVGQVQRLEDQAAFRKEALQLAMGQDFEIMQQGFDMQRLMNGDKRDVERQLAKMDINMALKLAEQASKEQAYKSIITGGVGIAQAGAQYDWSLAGPTTPTSLSTGKEIEANQSLLDRYGSDADPFGNSTNQTSAKWWEN